MVVLKPLTFNVKTILNLKPEIENYKKSVFDISIIVESVGLNISRTQVSTKTIFDNIMIYLFKKIFSKAF